LLKRLKMLLKWNLIICNINCFLEESKFDLIAASLHPVVASSWNKVLNHQLHWIAYLAPVSVEVKICSKMTTWSDVFNSIWVTKFADAFWYSRKDTVVRRLSPQDLRTCRLIGVITVIHGATLSLVPTESFGLVSHRKDNIGS